MANLMLAIPEIKENDLTDKKNVKRIMNYLANLDEQLRYVLNNIDSGNFTDETTSWIYKTDSKLAQLKLTDDGLSVKISDNEKGIATLEVTAEGIQTNVSDLQGNVSSLTQNAKSIQSTVSSQGDDINDLGVKYSNVKQTADSIKSEVVDISEDVDGIHTSVSEVTQTADKINWIVKSGTSASNFTLTSKMASLVADEIDISGFVTFNDLENEGSTTINGNNIETGTLSCDMITTEDGYNVFYSDRKLLEIGYGLRSGSEVLIGASRGRTMISQSNGTLGFFGKTGTNRQVVAAANTSDDINDLITKFNILLSALDEYGLIEKEG
ncbi:MAG: gp58-like family protein [Clostridia bacterium]|jgi:archaellum component FlaC|nr:gp58-like family protein [Clostridia bacterium]